MTNIGNGSEDINGGFSWNDFPTQTPQDTTTGKTAVPSSVDPVVIEEIETALLTAPMPTGTPGAYTANANAPDWFPIPNDRMEAAMKANPEVIGCACSMPEVYTQAGQTVTSTFDNFLEELADNGFEDVANSLANFLTQVAAGRLAGNKAEQSMDLMDAIMAKVATKLKVEKADEQVKKLETIADLTSTMAMMPPSNRQEELELRAKLDSLGIEFTGNMDEMKGEVMTLLLDTFGIGLDDDAKAALPGLIKDLERTGATDKQMMMMLVAAAGDGNLGRDEIRALEEAAEEVNKSNRNGNHGYMWGRGRKKVKSLNLEALMLTAVAIGASPLEGRDLIHSTRNLAADLTGSRDSRFFFRANLHGHRVRSSSFTRMGIDPSKADEMKEMWNNNVRAESFPNWRRNSEWKQENDLNFNEIALAGMDEFESTNNLEAVVGLILVENQEREEKLGELTGLLAMLPAVTPEEAREIKDKAADLGIRYSANPNRMKRRIKMSMLSELDVKVNRNSLNELENTLSKLEGAGISDQDSVKLLMQMSGPSGEIAGVQTELMMTALQTIMTTNASFGIEDTADGSLGILMSVAGAMSTSSLEGVELQATAEALTNHLVAANFGFEFLASQLDIQPRIDMEAAENLLDQLGFSNDIKNMMLDKWDAALREQAELAEKQALDFDFGALLRGSYNPQLMLLFEASMIESKIENMIAFGLASSDMKIFGTPIENALLTQCLPDPDLAKGYEHFFSDRPL